ncbi:MAG: hypothetical protein CTY33_00190 [Methylotenera sp.]|nr:MAG: hypothetical protein CTY33_00190 [Methylotenera sp.]
MCGKSGLFDINGAEICAGDKLKVTINIQHSKPHTYEANVVFYKGAFRFKNDRECFQSCVGDVSHNVDLEIIE